MIENHNICDFRVFDKSFESFNYLGHRDKQVIRQCIQNFAVVIGVVRAKAMVPKVLEIGAGLSTVLFSKMLNFPEESIKTIDAFALDAIKINSRNTSVNFKISELVNCEIIKGITINFDELNEFYSSRNSTIGALSHERVLSNLNLFLDINMEDRNYKKINNIINLNYISAEIVKDYFIKNSLFVNSLYDAYRTKNDEFHFLKDNQNEPVLRKLLRTYLPNIIYLDSGEYSSNIEFNIIDEVVEKGTLLLVQDIFFPKSIKSFLIASALMASDKWKVLWVDRTTPQGIMICEKK